MAETGQRRVCVLPTYRVIPVPRGSVLDTLRWISRIPGSVCESIQMSPGDNMEGVKADSDGQVNSFVLRNAKKARQHAAHNIVLSKLSETGDHTLNMEAIRPGVMG